jgi:hypothetical protein
MFFSDSIQCDPVWHIRRGNWMSVPRENDSRRSTRRNWAEHNPVSAWSQGYAIINLQRGLHDLAAIVRHTIASSEHTGELAGNAAVGDIISKHQVCLVHAGVINSEGDFVS